MLTLLSKELKSLLYSLSGLIFILIFLVISGSLLWIIPGEYNIPEGGYVSMDSFFSIAPFLLLVLVPALSMKSFSEEKKIHTLSLLLTRPVGLPYIAASKILAVWITVVLALVPTGIYVASLYYLAGQPENVDLGAILASYTGLLFLALSFSSISVFASALTSNQVVALILGLLFCACFYFGFDLISGMFVSGRTQVFVQDLGFLSHYQSVQRGLIDFRDLFYMLFVACLFFLLTCYVIGQKPNSIFSFAGLCTCLLLCILSYTVLLRMDCTKDRRYTLSETTKKTLKDVNTPVEIEFYLEGRLNPGFVHLQRAALDLIADFTHFSNGMARVQVINPYLVQDKEFIRKLGEQGARGVSVNEKDVQGKATQYVLYPWAKIRYKDSEVLVPLLVNQPGRSGEENLNTSIELLEYQFTHAIQLLNQQETRKIVFLEGHGELDERSLADVSDLLGKFYQVDRGVMSNDVKQLDNYELVVIAGPQSPFTEVEKYILDQYLMKGGRILWLVNGVQLQSTEALAMSGETVSRVNDVNLADLLFTYGVRIDPVLLQDTQCMEIPVNIAQSQATSEYMLKPWYYAPLLLPNQDNPVSKGLLPVKSEFASTISFTGDAGKGLEKQLLLASSGKAHLVQVPEMISLKEIDRKPDASYFNESFLPVAVLLEGTFKSGFVNRMLPAGIQADSRVFLPESKPAKMIVVASEEIARNEMKPAGEPGHWPVGYDPYSKIQYGNRDFILNAVNYLTDDAGLMSLRGKSLSLRLLDKQKTDRNKTALIVWNVVFPVSLFVVLYLVILWNRKRKYNY